MGRSKGNGWGSLRGNLTQGIGGGQEAEAGGVRKLHYGGNVETSKGVGWANADNRIDDPDLHVQVLWLTLLLVL